MNRAEAVQALYDQPSVKVNVAVLALGISRKTADKRRKIDGCIADGVQVIEVTERTLLVPSAAVLRALHLEGSPLGARLSRGGNGDGGAATSAVVSVPEPLPQRKDRLSDQGNRSPFG